LRGAAGRAAGLAREALSALASVVIAPECAACGRALERPDLGAVCPACWQAVRRFTPPVCPACGISVSPHATGPAGPCEACQSGARVVSAARAVGPYEGRLREIIHACKYERRPSLASPLATLLLEAGREVLDGADVVVPVPLHWTRRHQRGFNQAEALATRLGVPVARALRRTRRTRPQVELPAGDRHRNVSGAFGLARCAGGPPGRVRWRRGARPLAGRIVVLVDDVATTGATLDACARVLLEAGAREVRALTAARVASPRR